MHQVAEPSTSDLRKYILFSVCVADAVILLLIGLLGPFVALVGLVALAILLLISSSSIAAISFVLITSFITSVPGIDSDLISVAKNGLFAGLFWLTVTRYIVERRLPKTPIGGFEKSILLFTMWVGITTLTAVRPSESLFLFLHLVVLVAIYFITTEMATKHRHVKLILYLTFFATALTCVYTVSNILGGSFFRATGFLTNANYLGKLAIPLISMMVVAFYIAEKKSERYLFAIGVAMGTIFLALSWSRASILGMGGFAAVLLWYERRRLFKILTVGGMVVFVVLLMFEPFYQAMYKVARLSSGVTRREVYWEYAIKKSLDKPIFGHGFGLLIGDVRGKERLTDIQEFTALQEPNNYFLAHNFILRLLLATGAPGLALFLIAYYYLFKRHRYRRLTAPTAARRILHTAVIGILVASILDGMFGTGPFFGPRSSSNYMWIFLGLAVAIEQHDIDI